MNAIECWHGVNGSPSYFPFEICKRILVPFHLIYQKKVKIEWITNLQEKGIAFMIDSGAAYYYLNTNKEYPENYLKDYLEFLEKIKPNYAFALDFCFESPKYRTEKKLNDNFISQRVSLLTALKKGLILLPVVQGWNEESYKESAREVKKLLKLTNQKEFGIGSICRAKKERVKQVLKFIKPILNLEYAHGFGQTQRTIPILKRFKLARVDTSNASGNAANRCYCDPFGKWFYGEKSPTNPKHNFEQLFPIDQSRELYHYLFERNYESLEFSCLKVPRNWIHPVHNNRIDFYVVKEKGVVAP